MSVIDIHANTTDALRIARRIVVTNATDTLLEFGKLSPGERSAPRPTFQEGEVNEERF
jgi:hypothetical protein